MQIFGGVVAIAVIVIVVAIVVSSSGGGSSAKNTDRTGTWRAETADRQAVNAGSKGSLRTGTTLGNPKAKVTMTYFGDLECPVCAAFTRSETGLPPAGGLPEFIQKQVRTGKVKVIYKSYLHRHLQQQPRSAIRSTSSTPSRSPPTPPASRASSGTTPSSSTTSRSKEAHRYVTDAFLTGTRQQVHGPEHADLADRPRQPGAAAQVKADEAAAKAALPGTPTLIMTGPKGKETWSTTASFPSYSELAAAVQAVSVSATAESAERPRRAQPHAPVTG